MASTGTISRLNFITKDEAAMSHLAQVEAACRAGIRWIQLRMKHADDGDFRKTAREALRVCDEWGCTLVINDRVDIAAEVGAHGVHVGLEDTTVAEARKRLGPGAVIGGTANTIEDIRRHYRDGADYIGLGPFRWTNTKKNLSPLLGLEGYQRIMADMRREGIGLPVVGIGGIGRSDIAGLMEAGVYGIAFSGLLVDAVDWGRTVKGLEGEMKMSCELRAASYEGGEKSYELRAASYKEGQGFEGGMKSCELRATSYEEGQGFEGEMKSYELRAASYEEGQGFEGGMKSYELRAASYKEGQQFEEDEDDLVIAGKRFRSRLFTGTGKFGSAGQMEEALLASGSELVTVAMKRVDIRGNGDGSRSEDGKEDLLLHLKHPHIHLLPNTSGVRTAREAVFAAELAREALETNWIKLEIHPDPRWLMPDPVETLLAAETLVKKGFVVLPYIHADPVLCRRLEDVGVAAVMPLGSPIGSNKGLKTQDFLEIIIAQSKVPVVVDAGIGAPSDAAKALELGADAVLVNTAIAASPDPVRMARAFRLAVESGRMAWSARLAITSSVAAVASSPLTAFLDEL